MSGATQTVPLLGRQAELRELERVLARARDGSGSIVLLTGEAGIGKTRLCVELSRVHEAAGGFAMFGRACPEDGDVAFGPVADTLRAARRGRQRLWDGARARARVLAAAVPELASDGVRRGGSSDRPVLFEALLDLAEDAAGDDAALWVLDDIHRADDATWDFIKYAAARVADLRIVAVMTYREEEVGPGHPWSPRMTTLEADPNVGTIRLGRLAAHDTERLVRVIAPELPSATVAGVAMRSAGTPLLAEELAALAARHGDLPAVPDLVRATLHERMARLGPASRELLDLIAVAGLDVDQELLTALGAQHATDDLICAGILTVEDVGVRFRHPLLQEAAYQAVPEPRRRDLHAEVAAAIAPRGAHLVERVAMHHERAGEPVAALAALTAAADDARAAGEIGRAGSLRLAALALARRHHSLATHAEAIACSAVPDLCLAGRWSDLAPLIRAAWLRRDQLAADERARIAHVMALQLFWTGAIVDARTLVQEEIARLEAKEGLDCAAMLLAEAGSMAWFCGDPRSALTYAERSLEIARRMGDAEAECRARNVRIQAAHHIAHDRQATIAAHRENAAFARAHGLAVGEAAALCNLADHTGSLEDCEAAERAADRSRSWYASLARMLQVGTHFLHGRVDEAEGIFLRFGAEIRLGVPAVAPWLDVREAFLFLHRGDLDQARRHLDAPSAAAEAASLRYQLAERLAARGWLAWEEERWGEAAESFARCAEHWPVAAYATLMCGPIFVGLHVDALIRLDRAPAAALALASALELGCDDDPWFAAAGAAARFRLDATAESAVQAAALAAEAPWPWLEALVRCWQGELLRDPEAARSACEAFEQLGAWNAMQRAQRVLRLLGTKSIARSDADGLSPRELEVAELVAMGLSNPAIARRLYLSRPTVASHVAHILAKLGFASRAQIAAWVAERRAAGERSA